jgi:two-component system, LuxR family, response regulator FixJ
MSCTVAVVDDNSMILSVVKLLLEMEGCDVSTYSSSVSFLDDRAMQPDCLIVDQNMPEITGLDLVARLREGGSRIPVLLMTGSLSPDLVARAAQLGVEKIRQKPLEADVFTKFVQRYCWPQTVS